MKNRFLKLVLNKCKSNRNILLNKKDGNVTSLLAGLMFLMIIIILAMFNFRVTMISEVFYNIDDSLTASALGASTPNSYAYIGSVKYPEQGQLVLQDTLTSSSYVNYKQGKDAGVIYNEWVVVMSELNSNLINNGKYDAAKLSDPDNIQYKEDAAELKRLGFTSNTVNGDEFNSYVEYKKSNRTVTEYETYTLKVVNNLLGSTYANLTQSLVEAPKITSLSNLTNLNTAFCINKDEVLNKAFLGNYLNSDINISRVEIYDLYRYTLAKRHIYASPYITYTVNGTPGYTWDGYSLTGEKSTKPTITLSDGTQTNAVKDMVNATSKGVTITINGTACTIANAIDIQLSNDAWIGPTTEVEFKSLMKQIYPVADVDMYNMMRAIWSLDLSAWNSRADYTLIFWEDTGITHQTTWWANNNKLKNTYGYLWNNNSKNAIAITDNILATDPSGRKLLPVEGYSAFGYVRGKGITQIYNNFSVLADSTNGNLSKKTEYIKLGDFNADKYADDKSTEDKVYENRKREGTLYFSGVYIETAFDIIMFPNNSTDPNSNDSFLNLAEFSTQPVTQARLVTITKSD